MSKLSGFIAAAAMVLFSMSAEASHVFFSPVSINGVVLEDASGFTDPNIVINVGDSVTFKTTLTGSVDGPFTFSFNAGPGSTLSIADVSLPTGPTPYDVTYTVTFNSAGVFDGSIFANHDASTPDYNIPGGGQTDSRTYPFQITVQGTTSVPEPSAMLLFGAGAIGLAALRRRRG
jgi:hypothetical protein